MDLEKLSKLAAVIQILNLIIFGWTVIEARPGFSFSSFFSEFHSKIYSIVLHYFKYEAGPLI